MVFQIFEQRYHLICGIDNRQIILNTRFSVFNLRFDLYVIRFAFLQFLFTYFRDGGFFTASSKHFHLFKFAVFSRGNRYGISSRPRDFTPF